MGRNYWDHGVEMGGDPEREPPFFFSKPNDATFDTSGKKQTSGQTRNADGSWSKTTVYADTGYMASIPVPPFTKDFHYEAEMVVAIGKAGGNIKPDAVCIQSASSDLASPSY